MIFVIANSKLPLVVALALGLVVGWRTWRSQASETWAGRWIVSWFGACLLALAMAGLAIHERWLPGRPGLFLELAAILTVAYIAGCMIGSLARGLRPVRAGAA